MVLRYVSRSILRAFPACPLPHIFMTSPGRPRLRGCYRVFTQTQPHRRAAQAHLRRSVRSFTNCPSDARAAVSTKQPEAARYHVARLSFFSTFTAVIGLRSMS